MTDTLPPAIVLPSAQAYEAFTGMAKRQLRLKIRPAGRAWERVLYGDLLRIVEDGDLGTQIILVYTFMVAIIRGRNLQALADALEAERCGAIYQFDADRFIKPDDMSLPFVESIELHVETRVEDADNALHFLEPLSRVKH